MTLIFRPAEERDKWNVHSWRNAENVRQAMLTSHTISSEEHDSWWDRKMDDPTFRMMLLEEDGVAKAVQIYFDIQESNSAWWAFYFTPAAPEDMGPMLRFWKFNELAGLSMAFDLLKVDRVLIEVLRSNSGVLNWHKRFGFKPCDPSVSSNAMAHDLEVLDYARKEYEIIRDQKWESDLAQVEIRS